MEQCGILSGDLSRKKPGGEGGKPGRKDGFVYVLCMFYLFMFCVFFVDLLGIKWMVY